MKSKTVLAWFAFQVLLLTLASTSQAIVQVPLVHASTATVVAVVPSNVSASIDQIFSINLTVFDVQNLYGFELNLSWNSSVAKLVAIDDALGQAGGVLNQPFFVAQNSTQEGSYVIAAASTSPALPFNGTGNVVEMTFVIIGTGETGLNLYATLQDYPPPDRDPPVSLPIDHATISGVVYGAVPEFSGYLVVLVLVVLTAAAAVFGRGQGRKLIRRWESNRVSRLER